MDPSFFGLDGHPFDNSSDHDDSYLVDTHASLIGELRAGLKAPHGITLLIGEEGTGKTKLIRQFSDELAEGCTVAYLPTTGPGLRHLLTEIIEQLGGSPPASGDEQTLLETLAGLARARAQHGRSTLVVVDDAHELPAKTIERIGRLFGDDPADPSMLHVVLVGRPELLDRMNAANDRSILKHLVQVCRMDPIGPEESFRYIAERIAKVGGVVDKVFTQDALRLIVKKANGNPGRIDAICSAALQQAAEIGESAIGAETVDLACMGVEGFSTEGSRGKRTAADPMQYIFGDEEGERGGSSVQGRMQGSAGNSKESAETKVKNGERARAEDPTGTLGSLLAKVRERFAGLEESRRRLLVWAVGLIAVLVGFVAVTSRTGRQAVPIATQDAAKLASASKEELHADEAVQPAAQEGAAAPLNSDAVRTSKLVVNRDGSAPAQTPPPSATEPAASKPEGGTSPDNSSSPADAKPAEKPAEERPHIQAPAYAAPAADGAVGPTPAVQAKASPALETPPAQVAAAQPVAAPKTPAPAAETKPVESAPKPATPPAPPKRLAAVQSTTGGRYTVQVGAFKSRENAEVLLARVRKSYPDGRIIGPDGSGPAAVFRVVSGAFPSKADAESRARMLGASGYKGYVREVPR